jgi:hypothetical protein
MFGEMRRGVSSLVLVFGWLFLAVCVVPGWGLRGEEMKEARLSFVFPDSLVLHYHASSQMDQNYGGTDVRMNQSWDVDMSLMKRTEAGSKVQLKFGKTTSSVMQGTQLVDWQPPIKLQGASIDPTVTPKGEIVGVEPSGSIAGMHKTDQLKEIVQPWFITLPDTTVAVGGTWKKDIAKGAAEGAEPEVKGTIVYTLKKIEKRGNLEVAVIEGKAKLKINRETPAGLLVADGDESVKATLAVVGGYMIEFKETLDLRGNTISKDPLTDKEKKSTTAMTNYWECKLLQ